MEHKNKLHISVGIPAHNEAKNIRRVLNGILAQTQTNWELKEVIVICDGCTDNTEKIAKEVKSDLITVINDKQRKGKTKRLQELFDMFTGDILIMFDGDIEFSGKDVITNLIVPFNKKNVMLVGGNSKPYKPKTFVERAVYTTFSVFNESRKKIKKGHNIFGATGSILAIHKDLAKDMQLPNIVCEDAYIYLECVSRKHKFKYVEDAVIYYKLPTNFGDYIKQVFRSNPESVEAELTSHFGNLVEKEFHRPFSFYATAVLKVFIEHPLEVLTIMIINFTCRPFHDIVMKNYKLEWFTAHSTHN